MIKRLTAVLICVLLIALSGCSKGKVSSDFISNSDDTETSVSDFEKISIPYSSNDSFCPFEAVSDVNKELSMLLFDPMVKLKSDFSVEYILAEGLQNNGKSVTVTLKSVSFTDGSPVTADDVVYSANEAILSQSRYRDQLAAVDSVEAVDAKTVVFNLKNSDAYFQNMLDFPIIKKDSDKLFSEDNIAIPPIGCGRYILNDERTMLLKNVSYHGGEVALAEIYLTDTPDIEALNHNAQAGRLSCVYTERQGIEQVTMTGINNNVPLNNLVFIGVNMNNSLLNDYRVRQVVSSAIDRTVITKNAYYGMGLEAKGPLIDLWEPVKGLQTMETVPNKNVVLAHLQNIGYNEKDSEGYYINSNDDRLSFRLLCNSDNKDRVAAANLIARQLGDVGIYVSIEAVKWDAFVSRLKSGSFDLYIGEVKIGNNMDITPIATEGKTYGVINGTVPEGEEYASLVYNGMTAAAVSKLKAGKGSFEEVIAAFSIELPVIPVCHRFGTLITNKALQTVPTPSYSDIYNGIEFWSTGS